MWVGSIHKAICIPANSAKVLQGKTEKITCCLTCMVKAGTVNNLPMGLVVNRTMVTPNKSKKMSVTIVNTNSYSVWIYQPLLATDIVDVESCPWDYQSLMSHDGDNIKVSSFLHLHQRLRQKSCQLVWQIPVRIPNKTNKKKARRSKFGPRPKINKPDFDFKEELERLIKT